MQESNYRSKVKTKIKTRCKKCKNDTNQIVEYDYIDFSTREIFFEEEKQNAWIVVRQDLTVSECLGCNSKNLEIIETHIGKNDLVLSKIKNFNEPVFTPPKWIFYINDKKIFYLVVEIYNAANNSLYLLATMGIRTVIDLLLTLNVGDIGGFKQKLKIAHENKLFSVDQKKIIESVIDAGHAASHRGFNPDKKMVIDLIEILEYLLKTSQLVDLSKQIESATPKRNIKSNQ